MPTQPQPWPDFIKDYKQLKDTVRRLINRNPFFGTGVHPNGNQGLDSDNFVHGSSGFSLNGGTGVAEFKDIVLYNLPNSMLASPFEPVVSHSDGVNFTVPASGPSYKATVTITVPAGYTRALVVAYASASIFNPTGSDDYLYTAAHIQDDTSRGYATPTTVESGKSRSSSQTATALLTGLSGGDTFWCKVTVTTAFAAFTTSTSGNVANIDATVWFLR